MRERSVFGAGMWSTETDHPDGVTESAIMSHNETSMVMGVSRTYVSNADTADL
jgi:hypothetical protein